MPQKAPLNTKPSSSRDSDYVTIQNVKKLKTKHILNHLEKFYDIALKNNNSRSTTNGYNQTANYVLQQLVGANACEARIQYFKVPIWSDLGSPKLTLISENSSISFIPNTDFGYLRYGGNSASIKNASMVYIPNGACSSLDYSQIDIANKVALIDNPSKCSLFEASFALEQMGAAAVLISTPKSATKPSYARVRIVDWKENDPLMNIPVLSITHSTFNVLITSSRYNSTLDIDTKAQIKVVDTFNIICEGKTGNRNNTIVVGSHLDSVAFGPGINDNGSGSASTLEICLLLHKRSKKKQPKNKLVFVWFGSEEDGLLGSRHFIRDLQSSNNSQSISQDIPSLKLSEIAMNLNFDMIASPNYIPLVHNGSDAPAPAKCGSIIVQRTFEKYFTSVANKRYKITDMIGGSDFLPFINAGIPSGGILTGASEIKTEQERILFGGIANAQLDPCYHKYCDTINNINRDALNLMSKGAMYTISHFANSVDLRNELSIC
ncbi:Aminopeptidase [Smittium culicis]|uniref:Peptide hydrolase n=1 Tax=Smittium culicis TaxID=133412 RepID=A0A1R1Y9C1_9FUNG|nr:Aminopeptidase [Smittium culicis]